MEQTTGSITMRIHALKGKLSEAEVEFQNLLKENPTHAKRLAVELHSEICSLPHVDPRKANEGGSCTWVYEDAQARAEEGPSANNPDMWRNRATAHHTYLEKACKLLAVEPEWQKALIIASVAYRI